MIDILHVGRREECAVLWVSGGRRIAFRENESSDGDICVCVGIFHHFLLSDQPQCIRRGVCVRILP